MSRTRTLTDLISDCRQRANMENSTFVTDDEVTEYLNQELAELHARLGQGQGQPLYRSETSIAVIDGTALYGLPADFFTLQGVEAEINGVTGALRPFMSTEHAALAAGPVAWQTLSPVMYRVQGDNLEFLPATYSFTATVYYTPSCPRLVAGSDTFDGFNGFEVAAIYGVVGQMYAKESDFEAAGYWGGQKEQIFKHIDSLAAQRDASQPERVQDVMGGWSDDGWI